MISSTSRSTALLFLLSAFTLAEGFSSVVAPTSSGDGSGFGGDYPISSSPSSSTVPASPLAKKRSPLNRAGSSSVAKEIESDADWLQFMYDDRTNDQAKIKLVWFKSPTCKSCKRFTMDWKRKILPLSVPTADKKKKKMFVNELQLATFNVHHKGNQNLCKNQLQIKALPTVHIYHKGQLLQELLIGNPKEFHKLEDALQHYLNLSSSSLLDELNSSDEESYDDDHFATEFDL